MARPLQAPSQVSSRPLRKCVLIWLRNILLAIFLVILLVMLFVGVETWRRQQSALSVLGNDPIMSKQLLNMRFIKQEVKVDPVLLNWKPTSPEVINYFETDGDQRAVFDRLVKFAQENGWKEPYTSTGDNSLFFSAQKDNTTINIFIKKDSRVVSIQRS